MAAKLNGKESRFDPCPFCGGDYILARHEYDVMGNLKGYCECRRCHAKSNTVWIASQDARRAMILECNEEIAKLWNRRANNEGKSNEKRDKSAR